jgi:tetratricopeptide (TPR) repeat protein/DNA-binding MarR family transcriptional regulator
VSHAPHHYNPDWLDDDALVAGFIARQGEFKFLRDELARAPREGSAQHYLLIGPRGAGKTTLLKRLAVAIRREEQLSDHLIALSFPEELYQVKDLTDFWWAACEALGDELDRRGDKTRASQLFDAVDRARASRAAPTTEDGLKTLLACAAEIQRRPVLLVDNLDLVFERIDKKGRKLKDPLSPAYWALREALSTTSSPIVIGGSVRLSEPFTDYDKAFYDFFLPKRLGKLGLSEVRQVLEYLAEQQDSPEIKQRLRERPARIDALYDLTGGNPRAIGFIFQLLQQGPNSRVVEDFERLMDLTTPYYKARFEDLSEQAQVVMHALATRRTGDGSALRFGHTAAEIATYAGLPTNTVSAQMDVLEREGLIEKSAAHGRTQYRIAEQLFRLWLQMRGSRRIRQNVIGLAEFLEAMYDLDEMTAEIKNAGHGVNAARFVFALADTHCAAPLRRGLEAYATDCLGQTLGDDEHECRERLPNADLPHEIATLRELLEQLTRSPEHGLQPEEQEALLGSLELRLEQKQASVTALCQKESAPAEAQRLRAYLPAERQRLAHYGLDTDDLTRLFRLRTKGFLPLPNLTPGDADAVLTTQNDSTLTKSIWHLVSARNFVKFDHSLAKAWISWGISHATDSNATEWANFAGSLRRSKQLDIAAQALERAHEQGESSRTWYERAALLNETNMPSEAESAYQRAITLDSTDPMAWNGLGNLLGEKLDRPIEAEEAYRKAIAHDPSYAWPWNGLANLLQEKLNRPIEAEEAYRKAIELDPTFSWPWNNLANLLANKLNQLTEAEEAYYKAIELDPTYAASWHNLANLLSNKLDRPAEAEELYRKAIELDTSIAEPWNGLANLLSYKLDRTAEAEQAYRKAIELNPANAVYWNNLGAFLSNKLNRPTEAESTLRKAIELNPELGQAWGNIGRILEKQGKHEEAVSAFAQAAHLNPEGASYWQECHRRLLDQPLLEASQQAVQTGNLSAVRESLNELLLQAEDISTTLAGGAFIEDVLAPALADEHKASAVLGMLWGLGYDKHARPLLLAFEAAVESRPEALEDLEPEVRAAARHMYQRLIAASTMSP